MSSPDFDNSCPAHLINLRGTGSPPASARTVPPNSPQTPPGLKGSKKNVQLLDGFTGSSLFPLESLKGSPECEQSSATATGSPVALKRRNCMSGKRTRESKTPSSQSAQNHSRETLKLIGEKCFNQLRAETLRAFPLTSIFGNLN